MSLHDEIMNLPSAMFGKSHSDRVSYKLGHRDARHAAAELAIKADAEIERLTAERDAAIAAAVASEREACAKIADRGTNPIPATNTDRYLPGAKEASSLIASAIAKTIRARANP